MHIQATIRRHPARFGVLAFVLVMAIFLWIVDAVLVWGVKLLMGPAA